MKGRPRSAPMLAAAGVGNIVTTLDPIEWLTAAEAAAYLKIFRRRDGKPSVAAIRNLVYRGLLKAYKPFGKLLFDRKELQSCVEASRKEDDYGN